MKEMEAWIARDKDGKLFLYLRKPEKKVGLWVVSFDFSQGWVTDRSGLPDSLFEQYPTLAHRKDIRICLNDAKVVKRINQRMTQ